MVMVAKGDGSGSGSEVLMASFARNEIYAGACLQCDHHRLAVHAGAAKAAAGDLHPIAIHLAIGAEFCAEKKGKSMAIRNKNPQAIQLKSSNTQHKCLGLSA